MHALCFAKRCPRLIHRLCFELDCENKRTSNTLCARLQPSSRCADKDAGLQDHVPNHCKTALSRSASPAREADVCFTTYSHLALLRRERCRLGHSKHDLVWVLRNPKKQEKNMVWPRSRSALKITPHVRPPLKLDPSGPFPASAALEKRKKLRLADFQEQSSDLLEFSIWILEYI